MLVCHLGTIVDLDLLKTLMSVVDAGSHAEAARRLGVTPSAISQQLKQLEAQLGVPLFERIGRRSVPTSATRELVTQLKQPFDRVERAVELARGDLGQVRGTVKLGSPRPFGSVYLRPRLISLIRRYPQLELSVEFGVPSRLERRLVEGKLDLAILVTTPEHPSLTSSVIAQETFVAVASPEYLRERGRPTTHSDFLEHRYIVYDPDHAMHRPWWKAMFGARAEQGVNVVCAVASLPDMQALAEAGLGITVLPDYLVATSLERGLLEAITPKGTDRSVRNTIYLSWRSQAIESARLTTVRAAFVDNTSVIELP